MTMEHVEFEVGALYRIGVPRPNYFPKMALTLYIGFARGRHIFYIFEKSKSIYILNRRATRLNITKVETNVTER